MRIVSTTLLICLIAGCIGLRIYKHLQYWEVPGSSPVSMISGDDDSLTIHLDDIQKVQALLLTDFHGLDPEMSEDEFPPSLHITGQIHENDVNFLVVPVPEGRFLFHSYTQVTEDSAYGADILEFRPSSQRLTDVIDFSLLPSIPAECQPTHIHLKDDHSNDRYIVEMNGDLVHCVTWQRSWP